MFVSIGNGNPGGGGGVGGGGGGIEDPPSLICACIGIPTTSNNTRKYIFVR